jgi:hypothetical protein
MNPVPANRGCRKNLGIDSNLNDSDEFKFIVSVFVKVSGFSLFGFEKKIALTPEVELIKILTKK